MLFAGGVYEGLGEAGDEEGEGPGEETFPLTLFWEGLLLSGVLLPLGGVAGDGAGAGEDEGWLLAGVGAGVLTGVELELEELELEELLLGVIGFPPLSKILFWAPSEKPHSLNTEIRKVRDC